MRDCARLGWALGLLGSVFMIATANQGGTQQERVERRVERKDIPYTAQYEFSRSVGSGRLVKVQDGQLGAVVRTYKIVWIGKKVASKELVKEERIEPVSAKFLMGRNRFVASRSGYTRGKVMKMVATAYDPSPATIGPGATGRTATGRKATFGVVAVDPRVIPLGTRVFVEGYGYAIAADTGGDIKGNRIDLCYASRSQALRFGRRTVTVHILR